MIAPGPDRARDGLPRDPAPEGYEQARSIVADSLYRELEKQGFRGARKGHPNGWQGLR